MSLSPIISTSDVNAFSRFILVALSVFVPLINCLDIGFSFYAIEDFGEVENMDNLVYLNITRCRSFWIPPAPNTRKVSLHKEVIAVIQGSWER